jgi:signal transduction histidine kinase
VRDITALKQLERQFLERERLAAVGELAAMVAHEVRNPLAGIRGGCEILLEGYTPGDARHDIGVEIIHQVDRLTRTVHDLLTFARPRAVDPVPTDMHALIDRILQNLRDDPGNAAIEVVRDFSDDVSVVQVDGRQIEQVFLNLVLNAIQAMQHRGRVTISTRAGHRDLVVSVADSGPGIRPDAIAHIFQPFFTTRSQGTGLGLAIVKKIVEAHGGRIEAASPPGSGAVFTVTLPKEPS